MWAKSSTVSSKKRWIQTVKCGVQKILDTAEHFSRYSACGSICSPHIQSSVDFLVARLVLESVQTFRRPWHIQQETVSEDLGRSGPSFSEDFVLPGLFQSRMDLISSGQQPPIFVTDGMSQLLCLPFPFEQVEKGSWLMGSKFDQPVIVLFSLCVYPFLSPALKLLA